MGTFIVNVSGAFVLGFVFTVMTEQFTVAPWLRGAVTIGFLGAYTTFSTLSFETYRLARETARSGSPPRTSLGSIAAGLAAVYLGIVAREGAVTRLEGEGKLALVIFIGESDTWHASPSTRRSSSAYARRLAGATVLRGIEGYGADSHLHTSRIRACPRTSRS